MTDKALARLIEFLKREGWTAEKIVDLLQYIAAKN